MMLTKEECKNALNNILFNVGVARSDYRKSGKAKEDYCTLKSLIKEHFSNPPLKFEELKEGMWIWDDIDKEYRKVYGKGIYSGDEYFMKKGCKVVFISEDEYFYLIYEPNRFYRKEVRNVK